MKIYINQTPINAAWGGGNMWLRAMHQHMHINQLNHHQHNANIILISSLDGDQYNCDAETLISSMHKYSKIFLRVNENDARKGTNYVDNRIFKLSNYINGAIFVSDWLKEHFCNNSNWKCHNNIVIKNGVDNLIFKKNNKFNNNKINIVTHHWSNNQLKGFDIYNQLDKWLENNIEFTFTYIGREQGKFKNTNVIRPLFCEELRKQLGKYDIYVSASRFDPGPNHILESLSCNLPTYVHCDGGGCVEFAGLSHTYNTFNDLIKILLNKNFKHNEFIPNNWIQCVNDYLEFLLKE